MTRKPRGQPRKGRRVRRTHVDRYDAQAAEAQNQRLADNARRERQDQPQSTTSEPFEQEGECA